MYFTDSAKAKQNGALKKWQDFEDQLEAHSSWLRPLEAAFRDQLLQPTLKDKEERLQEFKEKRDVLIKREKEIDEFVDNSHGLLNSSGVERIQPLILSIDNR